jgi:sugar lactone lactonase YvrE
VLAGDQPPLPVASVAVRVVGIRPVDADTLNAPNDVVVASDNAIWFTDPGYGIDGFYEGHKDTSTVKARMLARPPWVAPESTT